MCFVFIINTHTCHWGLSEILLFTVGGSMSASTHAKSLQWCPILCDSLDCSPPVSSVHGILQARIWEWVAMPSSRRFSQPRERTCNTCIAGRLFTSEGSLDGSTIWCNLSVKYFENMYGVSTNVNGVGTTVSIPKNLKMSGNHMKALSLNIVREKMEISTCTKI